MQHSADSILPFARAPLVKELAETLLLLDYLSDRATSDDEWPYVPVKKANSESEYDPLQKIEEDLATPTALVRRIYAIRASLMGQEDKFAADVPSDAAFLSRAKSVLSEIASPATAVTIGFTSLVSYGTPEMGHLRRGVSEPEELSWRARDLVAIAQLAYPELVIEATRLARSVRWLLPTGVALATLGVAAVVGLGTTTFDVPAGWMMTMQVFAKAAYSSGIVAVLLGLLGALASILRRYQHLASAYLLEPGLRSKNHIDAWLGLIAGGGIGLVLTGMPFNMPGVSLAVCLAAFVVGYSTEIAFSLLDLLIVRLTRIPLFRNPVPQMKAVLKSQSAIADTVSQIHSQIEQIQGNVILDPFEGALIVRISDANGSDIIFGEYTVPVELSEDTVTVQGAKLLPEKTYDLRVTLDREAVTATNAAFERVTTGTGSEAVAIVFDVRLTGRDIRFTPKAQSITIVAGEKSGTFISRFQAPRIPGRYDIFAELYQKHRLVQVALLPAVIESSGKGP
ncbi:hypothetical protein [Rhizobium laguerreae]|uniref:hypothetical protein n=1 Tax=Rhizobium laguerreae TaxID=1076926 RepID=UPI0014426BC4|nr:hypothetical protein [Rhizobium laguerreae]NKM69368.1 hypothetical protein [Rhizobium laguerreae]